MTEKAVWHIVKNSAKRIGLEKSAPHDLRGTCARLCHTAVGDLEQIHFLLGHVSIQTKERTWAASSGFGRRSMIGSESISFLSGDIPEGQPVVLCGKAGGDRWITTGTKSMR